MRCTRSLASSDTGTLSGNEYAFDRMRLYVCLMSVVSKGGLPTRSFSARFLGATE
jgi:hypothetical protein